MRTGIGEDPEAATLCLSCGVLVRTTVRNANAISISVIHRTLYVPFPACFQHPPRVTSTMYTGVMSPDNMYAAAPKAWVPPGTISVKIL